MSEEERIKQLEDTVKILQRLLKFDIESNYGGFKKAIIKVLNNEISVTIDDEDQVKDY